jgi:tripartite-type tricarboxylate transporter receptor subunit TctC
MEAFKAALGLDIIHVPFKGTGQSIPALVGGQVQMAIAALTSVAPHVKAGKLKILGANTRKRSPLAPEVPSMAEAGVADFDFPGELALLAPAGTPRAVIGKLSAALNQAVHHPESVARLAATGMEPVGGTPEQLAATIRADIPKYARVVKISGAKVD